ncbi:nucleotide-binding universal stress UspA family protein [Pullulanibacillus pueri]|uniref:Universal stress protein YxiE n=1 Tax=Pullulanibacillus pueri TaxID=1437324 RepID=A0A8J3A095_9BACL|nr:universal stress protein [Pullulanibacillus pueri]MBM7684107.1 nucleotide-binding universal stress UspA family protein [Pullulanibacillus pueri]GGH88672.1 universal stress protein YxiE [Pullulanibacillus pueri]
MRYNNIMVAFDGSEGSQKALVHAANHLEGELTVVTVVKERKGLDFVVGATSEVNPVVLNNGMYQYPVDRQASIDVHEADLVQQGKQQEVQQEGEDILRLAKEILEKQHVKAKTEVLEGEPVQVICEHAQVNDFDLIVVGSRGVSGIKKLVLGSVSQKVIQESECPVLVVK